MNDKDDSGNGPSVVVSREELIARLGNAGNGSRAETVADAVGVDVSRVIDLAAFKRVEEDTIATAQNRLVVDAVVHSEPWEQTDLSGRREAFCRSSGGWDRR